MGKKDKFVTKKKKNRKEEKRKNERRGKVKENIWLLHVVQG